MEVLRSKVEELKLLIDSTTPLVKKNSVHFLQDLLHRLVAFYSSHRLIFRSLVVVDTKTGKEQRFHTFRELLDISDHLISQTNQRNVSNNQYLQQALGNKASISAGHSPSNGQSTAQPDGQPSGQYTSQVDSLIPGFDSSRPVSLNRSGAANEERGNAVPIFNIQKTTASQEQFLPSCPQAKNANITVSSLTNGQLNHVMPVLAQSHIERALCVQKDEHNFNLGLFASQENDMSPLTATSQRFLSNNSTAVCIGDAIRELNCTHQLHCNAGSAEQLQGQASLNNVTTRPARSSEFVACYNQARAISESYNIVLNGECHENERSDLTATTSIGSFSSGYDSLNTTSCISNRSPSSQQMPTFSQSLEHQALLSKSSTTVSQAARHLRGLVDSCISSPGASSNWKSLGREKADAPNAISKTQQQELCHSFTLLEGNTTHKPDVPVSKPCPVVVRQSLSRLTDTPMTAQLPRNVENESRRNQSLSDEHLRQWPDFSKPPLMANLQNKQQANGTFKITPNFADPHFDKEQALHAILKKKMMEYKDPTAKSVTRSKKRLSVSKRKSSSPQKRLVNPSAINEKKDINAQNKEEGSIPEIVITSDSANDDDMDQDSSSDSGKCPKVAPVESSPPYHCFYCNTTDEKVNLKSLLIHLKEAHVKINGDKTGLPCPECGKLFKHRTGSTEALYSTMLACLNHMMCQHSSEVPAYMKVHKCGHCNFVSLIKTIVKRHEQSHSSQGSHLQAKMQPENGATQPNVSGGETSTKEDHKCGVCQKTYSSKSALSIHTNRKHMSVSSFLCCICPSKFYGKVDLERHMFAQHAVNISKRAVIKCPICDYQSLEGSLMRKHIKNHQKGSFLCDICNKEFATENRLKSHRMIHTAERKYKCEHCEYATAKRYHFERHVAVRHKGQFWMCSACSMLTFNKVNVQKHINKVHQGKAEVKEAKEFKRAKKAKKQKREVSKTASSNTKKDDTEGPITGTMDPSSHAQLSHPTADIDMNTEMVSSQCGIIPIEKSCQPNQNEVPSTLAMAMTAEQTYLL